MSKHTPTPWKIGYGDGIFGDVASWSAHMDDVECHEIVIRSGREAVAIIYYGDTDGPSEANARHIVKAVNYHDRLTEALRNAVRIMESDAVQIEGEWGVGKGLESMRRDGELPEELEDAVSILTELDQQP